ncbi:hypothetical protein [Xanthomonas phage JGB6]|nr:hypothetical protein [Xanthomonas phage JGB6]
MRFSDYYRGGTRVPNVEANNGVPTSGPIYFSHFYNATRITPLNASAPGISAHSNGNSVSGGTTVSASGGNGSGYSVSNAVWASGGSNITISRSGMSVTVSTSGQNVSRSGTLQITVTDGSQSVSFNIGVDLSTGTPV